MATNAVSTHLSLACRMHSSNPANRRVFSLCQVNPAPLVQAQTRPSSSNINRNISPKIVKIKSGNFRTKFPIHDKRLGTARRRDDMRRFNTHYLLIEYL